MISIHNILSVAKYESKTLTRSWFFRIFAALVILIIVGFNLGNINVNNSGDNLWILKALPAALPYANLLMLNVAQAIISIFLAADFLKRDKKLDTTETIYMRPMSNTEYVLGKTWGNLKVFILLNVIVLIMTLLFNLSAGSVVDWSAYLIYFVLISIPTLVFIMGLSFLLMRIIKNQALTFVLLLGYIVATLLFLQNKYYYLFDYMAFNIPMLRSEIVGFANVNTILVHRGIYLFLGLGFISFTIYLLKRLPNSKKVTYWSLLLGVAFVLIGAWLGFGYVSKILTNETQQKEMISLNNKYVKTPRLVVAKHQIILKQLPNGYNAQSEIEGKPNIAGNTLVFSLNPGLKVETVKQGDKSLPFKQKNHLILVHFTKPFSVADNVSLSIKYAGTINENICYPDVDLEARMKRKIEFIFDADKRFAFTKPNYLLVTPETYWYPISGVGYSTTDATWYHKDFIDFKLTVEPLKGLMPVSQGKLDTLKQKYQFKPEQKLTQISLAIGDYKRKQLRVDSMEFNLWYFKGHDYFSDAFPDLKDTLGKVIEDRMSSFENAKRLKYLFPRLNLVETPIQFTSFQRIWTSEQEVTQPEMVFLPEKLATVRDGGLDWKKRKERERRWRHEKLTDEQWQLEVFGDFLHLFQREEGRSKWTEKKGGSYNITKSYNPYYQFAQLFNFNYNLNSAEWPIMNRVLEAYLSSRDARNHNWRRNRNGISDEEKVNMLLQEHSLAELLTNKEYKQYIRDAIKLKAQVLFTKLKVEIGAEEFDTFLEKLLKEYQFKNLDFELFDIRLQQQFNVSVKKYLNEWFNSKKIPQFLCSTPEVIKVKDGEDIRFRVHFKITNFSDVEGVVKMTFSTRRRRRRRSSGQENVEKFIKLDAKATQELYFMLDDKPRTLTINTLISKNLPSNIEFQFGKVEKKLSAKPIERIQTVAKPVALVETNEIIVDNEDENFSVAGRSPEGLLQKWLLNDEQSKDELKYKGYRAWRAPINWTLTTNSGFYGSFVRSAYYIRTGDGDKKAIWKIPIKKPGYYEVMYHVYKDDTYRWDREIKGVYNFSIIHDGSEEKQDLTFRDCENGWNVLGTYYFAGGATRIELTNDSDGRNVVADAVKLVRQED